MIIYVRILTYTYLSYLDVWNSTAHVYVHIHAYIRAYT